MNITRQIATFLMGSPSSIEEAGTCLISKNRENKIIKRG